MSCVALAFVVCVLVARVVVKRSICAQAATEDSFEHVVDTTFTVKTADGRTVPLLPGPLGKPSVRVHARMCHACAGGDSMEVTWENRLEYARLTES